MDVSEFLNYLSRVSGSPVVESIRNVIAESQLAPLVIPDSIHSTAVMQTGTGIKCPVGTSAGSVGGPNVAGAYKYSPALANPTRDSKEETDEAFAQKPKFPPIPNAVSSVPVKKLIERSPSKNVGGVTMDATVMASAPVSGFSTKAGFYGNRGTINGVDVGSSAQGGASTQTASPS